MGAIEKLRASFRRQQAAAGEEKTTTDVGAAKHEGEGMTKTTATEVVAKQSGEKEKAGKRRALGRGLDSLLPGPRVVSLTSPTQGGMAGAPQMPTVRSDNSGGGAAVAVMQAVGEEVVVSPVAVPAPGPEVATGLGSAGHPGAAVPTPDSSVGIANMAQADTRLPLTMHLAISDIDKNPFQTRYVLKDDALEELTNSIKANGVLQPIVVRPAKEDGRYILILGERRLHASKMAGRNTIPAIIRRVSEQQAAEMTIIENLQREDLSPLEQAQAFRVLSEEFKLTQTQIGERIGLSRESVSNYMRLLRLPEPTMKFLAEGDISFATAKELLKLDDKDLIAKTATQIVEKGMTFDQVEKLVWGMIGVPDPVPGMPGQEKKKSAGRWVDPNVRAAQNELERLLGVRVRIRDRKGKGRIVIEYSNVDDYERLVGMLRGKKS